jgi:two-component system, NarL family, response regulator DevR
MSLENKTILLIDDHALIRDGIRSAISALGFESIFEAATRSEAFAQMAHKNPDVIVVDLNLPDGHGLEIVQWARRHSETIAIVILSLNADTQMIKAAGAAGASAYISKSAPISELVAAIEIALKSPLYFLAPTGTAIQSLDSFALSPREIQILVAMDTSAKYSEMARLHFISEATLKSHISSIFTKLGVNSRIAALVKAKKNGLL